MLLSNGSQNPAALDLLSDIGLTGRSLIVTPGQEIRYELLAPASLSTGFGVGLWIWLPAHLNGGWLQVLETDLFRLSLDGALRPSWEIRFRDGARPPHTIRHLGHVLPIRQWKRLAVIHRPWMGTITFLQDADPAGELADHRLVPPAGPGLPGELQSPVDTLSFFTFGSRAAAASSPGCLVDDVEVTDRPGHRWPSHRPPPVPEAPSSPR